MKLNELKPQKGSRKKRKRVGRGTGSGRGKTAGRGHKGSRARAGGGMRPGFEGGQMPMARRLPKRGFSHVKKEIYILINIESLNQFKTGEKITLEVLKNKGFIKKPGSLVKILGKGKLTKKNLTINAHAFSRGAREQIEALSGKVEVIKNV